MGTGWQGDVAGDGSNFKILHSPAYENRTDSEFRNVGN